MCDKTCVFFFFPIINKYFLMAKRSLLSRCPSYFWNVAWCRLVVGYRHFEAIYYYSLVVKVFNMLPYNIKIESDNPKKFKLVLQKFLYKNSFYSLDGYF